VWAAVRLDGSGDVAIKETLCRSQDELQDAENESKILQMVGNVARSPGAIACETKHLPSGVMSVRLAMAKVPGDSLGTFLQQRNASKIGDASSQFAEACNFTHELLVQLVPTLDAISHVALHRDINTHNVLVSTGVGGSLPQFSIIDFGLAIDIQNWQTLLTRVPVVGDCRYWPVSAWYIFAHGGPKLMENQSLFMEYRTQLDLHAFGITAMQVFSDMLPQASSSAVVAAIPEEIWALKSAWEQYWQDAYRLWEPLYKAFERKTDWETLRKSYIANETHNIIDKSLGHLRRALCTARDACAHVEPGSKLVVILSALAELISQGARPLGREAGRGSMKLASWSDIASLLNSAPAAPRMSDSYSHRGHSKERRGSTTSMPVHQSSTTSLHLPIASKLHGSSSTPHPSYLPATTTRLPPNMAMIGNQRSPVGSPTAVNSPTMVISGATTRSPSWRPTSLTFVPMMA
jgi:serine/threonine protein kinase